jgi:glycosyltransferase involved in cell wall biosynthesis
MPKPGVTFLIPCLDEAKSLPKVLATIQRFRKSLRGRPSEVLVSDNGSTDGSQVIARKAGARVVHCPVRGYGAALRFGIAQARHPYVIFADADNTYDFSESQALIEGLDAGADLVLGSRLKGRIQPGAMPWSHRWIGTPLPWSRLMAAGLSVIATPASAA